MKTDSSDAVTIDTDGVVTFENFMQLTPRETAPSNPSQGIIYSDSSNGELCYYTGSSWVGLVSGGPCT